MKLSSTVQNMLQHIEALSHFLSTLLDMCVIHSLRLKAECEAQLLKTRQYKSKGMEAFRAFFFLPSFTLNIVLYMSCCDSFLFIDLFCSVKTSHTHSST